MPIWCRDKQLLSFYVTAFDELYRKEAKMNQIYADYAALTRMMMLLAKAGELQQELEAGDFCDSKPRSDRWLKAWHHGDGDGSSG